MNTRRSVVPVAAVFLVLALALPSGVRDAHALCTYNTPMSSALVTTSTSNTMHRIPATWQRSSWLVSAVSAAPGDDWDVRLYQNTAAEPTCVSNLIASSNAGGSFVDFVVGDMRKTPHADVYAQYNRFYGTGIGRMQWKDAGRTVETNGAPITSTWTSDSLFDAYEVHLYVGTEYTFQITGATGVSPTMYIFRNPGNGSYWAGKGAAIAATSTSTTVTPDSTGDYLVVMTNDTHASGSYQFMVGDCVRYGLGSGEAYSSTWAYANWWTPIHGSRWCAIGTRSAAGADYDLQSIDYFGGPYPGCTNLVHATSAYRRNTRVEVVAADYDHYAPFYASMQAHFELYSGAAGVWIEADSGAVDLIPNATSITRISNVNDVLETFNVSMVAGVTYNFIFQHSGADHRVLLFRNPGTGEFYAGRSGALVEQTGSFSFTAPATDRYGLVVVDDDGAAGWYRLGVTVAPCVVPTTLAPGVAVGTTSPDSWYEFAPDLPTWGAVATRGATTTDDWDLSVSNEPTGTAWPGCIGPVIASSGYGPASVDLVAFDFTHLNMATYYARSHHLGAGSTPGRAEWFVMRHDLERNGMPYHATMTSTDLVQVYTAYMYAGTTYTIELAPETAGLTALVFENPEAGLFYGGRASAGSSGTGTFSYSATTTGYHGIAVANDGIVSTGYTLRYGSCVTPVALTNQVAVNPLHARSTYTIQPTARHWLAVGLYASAADWDLGVSGSAGTVYPNCTGAALATSTNSTVPFVDVVVGNFGRSAIGGPYYVDAHQFTIGAKTAAEVMWDATSGTLILNDVTPPNFVMSSVQPVRAFDVSLKAGVSYTLTLSQNMSANLHLLVFRSPTSGVYWAGRSSALLDLPASTGTVTWTAPATDGYGIIVVDDDGMSTLCSVAINYCPAPVALADTVAVPAPAGSSFYSFTQPAGFWTAIAARGTEDFDLSVFRAGSGGLPGTCLSDLLALSSYPNPPFALDFVVGDFNAGANPAGTYYARTYNYSGSLSGQVEWAKGSAVISSGAGATRRSTGPGDLLAVWDTYLLAGQTYGLYFTHNGAADVRAFLFRNPTGGEYWAARSQRFLDALGHTSFTAPSTGWYGLAVANDNGLAGEYDIGIQPAGLDAGATPPPAVTALHGVSPNPARGEWAVEYALHEGAHVRIDMLDMAGRRVATLEDQERGAGTWRAMWSGAHMTGGSVPPGLYFVRLQVAGRVVGERKVALVP